MVSRLKIVMVAFAALGLAGCSGGGGSGGSAQNSQTQMGSGGTHTAAVYAADWTSGGTVVKPQTAGITRLINDLGLPLEELGTLAKPFWQQSLAYRGITDPNAVVLSPSNVKYDLTWGALDPAGPGYASSFSSGSYQFPVPETIMGRKVSGGCTAPCPTGPTFGAPQGDVIDAWNQGWTGLGRNILIIDGNSASNPLQTFFSDDVHGISTLAIAKRYAYGSSMYGLDALFSGTINDAKIVDMQGVGVSSFADNSNANAGPSRSGSGFYFDVINMSFGLLYDPNTVEADRNDPWLKGWESFLSGTVNIGALQNAKTGSSSPIFATDAVVALAAGNQTITTEKDPFSYVFSRNGSIAPRLLLVGALDGAGFVDDKATIASYSNTAGSDPLIQGRFLVASGTLPFINGDVAIDDQAISGDGAGTSFAAPRVAGYAAIVRQKFPNLSGANTADILLATARYDTLTCNPNCSKEIYGQGEASLSRALAPVGRLK